jgi:hypothetical protein
MQVGQRSVDLRTDCMNDRLCIAQLVRSGKDSISGRATVESVALFVETSASCAEDRPADTSAPLEPWIGCVDDCILVKRGDVGLHEYDAVLGVRSFVSCSSGPLT